MLQVRSKMNIYVGYQLAWFVNDLESRHLFPPLVHLLIIPYNDQKSLDPKLIGERSICS